MNFIWTAYFFALGAAVGSFLNVVIYRVPKGESIVRPSSHCPICNSPVKPYHNIPILSWLLLGGKCASCGGRISPRYMLVEFITALLFAFCWKAFGFHASSFVYMALCAALVAVVFIDLDHLIIPDVITLPGIFAGFICAYLFLPLSMKDSALGFLAGGGIFFLLAVLVPGGMGGGDIKLMAMVGAFLGWKYALLTIFLGSLAGSIGGIIGILLLGKERKTKIPFGPYLAVAAISALFFGNEMIDLYLRMIFPDR